MKFSDTNTSRSLTTSRFFPKRRLTMKQHVHACFWMIAPVNVRATGIFQLASSAWSGKSGTSNPRVSDKTASCTRLLLCMFSNCFERHGNTTKKEKGQLGMRVLLLSSIEHLERGTIWSSKLQIRSMTHVHRWNQHHWNTGTQKPPSIHWTQKNEQLAAQEWDLAPPATPTAFTVLPPAPNKRPDSCTKAIQSEWGSVLLPNGRREYLILESPRIPGPKTQKNIPRREPSRFKRMARAHT